MNLFSKKISESEIALNKLQAEFDALNEQFAAASQEVVSLTESLATVQSEFARVNEENKSLKEQIEQANTELAEVVIDASEMESMTTDKAVEIVASLGVPPVEITDDEPEESLTEQLAKLKGTARTEFFNKHRKELIAALKGQ